MTMLKPGKVNEIAEQMLSTQIHVIVLQEIRRKGHGQIKKISILYIIAVPNKGWDNLELDLW